MAQDKDYRAITARISAYAGELRRAAPPVMQGFGALAKAAMLPQVGAGPDDPGRVDARTKEMIALAIGVTQHCDGCIGFHVKALRDLGTTREELVEVLGVCVYMGGGPALMYAADALRAFDQFAEASAAA